MLTDKEIEEYIAKDGVICPYCGSKDLHTGDTDWDCGVMWMSCMCGDCDREWVDQYTLSGISED
jgi:hypothetical protein